MKVGREIIWLIETRVSWQSGIVAVKSRASQMITFEGVDPKGTIKVNLTWRISQLKNVIECGMISDDAKEVRRNDDSWRVERGIRILVGVIVSKLEWDRDVAGVGRLWWGNVL